MSEGIELPSKRIKKIVDHKQTGENQFFYRVVFEGGKQEWMQDVHLVGCDRLIEEFFTRQTEQLNLEGEVEKKQVEPDQSNKIRTRSRHKKPHHKKEQKVSSVGDWNVGIVPKRRKKQRSVGKSKTPIRSKKYKDTILLEQKVRELKNLLEGRSAEWKLDYLLDYIEGVFMKNNCSYCVVKTMPPVRTYVVSLKHMEQFFPKTLKEYFERVIKLHQRTNKDTSSVYQDDQQVEEGEEEEEEEIRSEHNASEEGNES